MDADKPETDEQRSRQRRNVRSGALGRVLEELQQAAPSPVSESKPAIASGARVVPPAAPRAFFPGKGPATVPAESCRPWALADRPEEEFEHLDDLIRSFGSEGQLQPVIVRPIAEGGLPGIRYEVIAGQARWRAARKSGRPLDVVVRPMSDEAAFRVMVGENEFRRGLSDYAKAKRLARALEAGLYSDKGSLASAVGLSNSQLSYYLGFAELDPVVVTRFKRLSSVPVRLGYVLAQAVKSGYLPQILRDLAKIEDGTISREQIPEIWSGAPVGEVRVPSKREAARGAGSRAFEDDAGRALFAVKIGAKGRASVQIESAVAGKLDDGFWESLRQLVASRMAD